jgi:hypothetical protein
MFRGNHSDEEQPVAVEEQRRSVPEQGAQPNGDGSWRLKNARRGCVSVDWEHELNVDVNFSVLLERR